MVFTRAVDVDTGDRLVSWTPRPRSRPASYEADGEVATVLSDPLRLGEGVYTLVVREGREAVKPTGDKE